MLSVRTTRAPGGIQTWRYHVAPVVTVRYSNVDFNIVCDPSLFNRMVTEQDWDRVQTTTRGRFLFLTCTAFGILPDGRRTIGSYAPLDVDPPDLEAAAGRCPIINVDFQRARAAHLLSPVQPAQVAPVSHGADSSVNPRG